MEEADATPRRSSTSTAKSFSALRYYVVFEKSCKHKQECAVYSCTAVGVAENTLSQLPLPQRYLVSEAAGNLARVHLSTSVRDEHVRLAHTRVVYHLTHPSMRWDRSHTFNVYQL